MHDYGYMALSLANLSGIPVRLYREGKFEGLYHTAKFHPDPAMVQESAIFANGASVSYYMTEEFLFYGLFRAAKAPVCMVLGPVAQLPPTEATARRMLRAMGENEARAGELLAYLATIPAYPLRNFLQILCTFAYFFNGEKLTVSDILGSEPAAPLPTSVPAVPEASPTGHDTYALEQELCTLIRQGRPDALQQLYRQPAAGKAGRMAQDALRQQKNLLIVTATLASRAAIQGGLDVATSFAISDVAIQKAELMTAYEPLTRLMMQLTLDLAARVQALRCGTGNRLVHRARQHILAHLGEKLTGQSIADAIGCSRSALCEIFRTEAGCTVNEYLRRTRLEEATRLLEVTDKPLADIAQHLGYSSQSYFQNCFRREFGMTPGEYRQRHTEE